MKIIFALVFLLISLFPSEQKWSIEGNTYYWENGKNDFNLLSEKSVLKFDKDSVKIIDFPVDPAGMLNYYSGLYHIDKHSNYIEIQIIKTVTFSLNIGKVAWYTKNCSTNLTLNYIQSGEIVRNKNVDFFHLNANQNLKNNGLVEMKYELLNDLNFSDYINWLNALENFESLGKLRRCN